MFLYWCGRDFRWKGTHARHLQKIQRGGRSSLIGAAPGADLLSPALLVGWHEWHQQRWVFRPIRGGPAAGGCRSHGGGRRRGRRCASGGAGGKRQGPAGARAA
ncbi:unnamed protein product, partial [Prorocentrum cordatum]